MLKFLCLTSLSATLLVTAAHAQERSAAGNLETQMTWSALKNLIDNNSTLTQAVNTRVDQIVLCNKKTMLYAPGPNADTDGCISAATPPSALNLVTVDQNICKRGGRYDVVAKCPAGKHLLTCSGGPGDQDETGEYWVLENDYANEQCIGHVGEPACFTVPGNWARTNVKAICY